MLSAPTCYPPHIDTAFCWPGAVADVTDVLWLAYACNRLGSLASSPILLAFRLPVSFHDNILAGARQGEPRAPACAATTRADGDNNVGHAS